MDVRVVVRGTEFGEPMAAFERIMVTCYTHAQGRAPQRARELPAMIVILERKSV